MKNIGFIGLGNMGKGMCLNLLKTDLNIFGYDINLDASKEVRDKGIKILNGIEDITKKSDVIITMLPNGENVREVWKVLVKFSKSNQILVDCSTIDVKTSLEMQNLAIKHGLKTLDAPVSGGVIGADNGTLTFMVGGEESIFLKIKPLFNVMGQNAILCGNIGSGQSAKICNNMLLASTMIAVGESFKLGKNLNLNLDKLFEVISTSSGSCWAVNNYCPFEGIGPKTPADNSYKGGFSANLMHKDLTLAIKAANDCELNLNYGKQTLAKFSELILKHGQLDFSNVVNIE